GTISPAQAGSLTNHSDVVAANLAAGHLLIYNSAACTNGPQLSVTSIHAASNNIPVWLSLSGTNVRVDASLCTHFRALATTDCVLQNPTHASDFKPILFEIIHDSVGGRTMTLGSAFRLGTDLQFVNLTTNANVRDFISCVYSGTNFYVVGLVKGY